MRRVFIGAALIVGLGALIAYRYQDVLIPWIDGKPSAETILVSGNIEAHESVVSFKTVQSRIVELPFDEGQAVKAGTVLARVDAADYKQQVAIADAALNAQMRQLDVAEQNVDRDAPHHRQRRGGCRAQAARIRPRADSC